MHETELICDSVLTPSGWISPARLLVGPDGLLQKVQQFEGSGKGAPAFGHIVPGMPNVHSHAFQRQMAGLTESTAGHADNFWTWRDAMYRLAGQLTPESLQAIATGLQVEMLEAGFTSCAEFHYLHHQPGGGVFDDLAEMGKRLLAAADRSGIGLTLLPVLYCRSGFGSKTVEQHQKRFFNDPVRFLALLEATQVQIAKNPLHHLGIAPHSLRAVSVEQISEVLGAPMCSTMPIHMHIAEQYGEVEESLAVHGKAPLRWLLDSMELNERWCLVHAIHITPDELEDAAASGAVAGICPVTEADLGDGFFKTEAWQAASGNMAVGTDSNLQVSVINELRLLEFQTRMRLQRRNVLTQPGRSCGRSLYERTASGGAQALQQNVGRIEVGRRADLVELDRDHILLDGRNGDTVLDSWIFAGSQEMVKSVWVAGEQLVREGRHIRRDEIYPDFARTMKELL